MGENMKIFCCDLDNTLIFSYKHDIGIRKQCVETYQGRKVSFITEDTAELLEQIKDKLWLVPTTTRTIEQYQRINFSFTPRYALTCNGGVLLVNGKEEMTWYKKSKDLVMDCQKELSKAETILEQDIYRNFEIRNIKELFLFTKSMQPQLSVENLKSTLDNKLLDISYNGQKVYIIPKNLNKGMAIKRFREWFGADEVIAAGDSEFDIPMLREADIGLAPIELKHIKQKTILIMEGEGIFSEFVLNHVLKIIEMEKICDFF